MYEKRSVPTTSVATSVTSSGESSNLAAAEDFAGNDLPKNESDDESGDFLSRMRSRDSDSDIIGINTVNGIPVSPAASKKFVSLEMLFFNLSDNKCRIARMQNSIKAPAYLSNFVDITVVWRGC